ncbi:hypothetical protein ABE10_01990, partial [Bacillus toyonensis]|nr:hypothetical protein [Bacillus toyonensis]
MPLGLSSPRPALVISSTFVSAQDACASNSIQMNVIGPTQGRTGYSRSGGEEGLGDVRALRRAGRDRPESRADMTDVLVHQVGRQLPLQRDELRRRALVGEEE